MSEATLQASLCFFFLTGFGSVCRPACGKKDVSCLSIPKKCESKAPFTPTKHVQLNHV